MLSVVATSIKALDRKNAFARVDMRQLVRDTYQEVCGLIERWPEDAKSVKDIQRSCDWITKKVETEWAPFVHADKDVYGTAVFACIAERIIADLKTRIRDKCKLAMLEKIEDPIRRIHDFADPGGANFQAYEKADYALDELYRLIDWRWEDASKVAKRNKRRLARIRAAQQRATVQGPGERAGSKEPGR